MIRERTVLVLGAGASYPYGFPLGLHLVDTVCNEVDQGDLLKRLHKVGYDPAEINFFAKELRRARPGSIDAFLETRKEFRRVGKAAIADVLLRAERTSLIGSADPREDWYRYLFNRMLHVDRDFYKGQAHLLTVVTFNFDRSFEYTLFERISARFGSSSDEAVELVTRLRVYHVHGSLGEPAWLQPGLCTVKSTPYGLEGEQLLHGIPVAAAQIRIVDEELDPSVIAEVSAALSTAHHIYFLGFGFDERNLKKLSPTDTMAGHEHPQIVRATALGFTAPEVWHVERLFGNAPGTARIHLYLDADVLTFLRTHAHALFA